MDKRYPWPAMPSALLGPRRIGELDALRGLALCGIVPVNLVTLADVDGAGRLYEALLHQRFFPIFSFLFGLGGALFLRTRDRTALLARFGFLIPFGLVHQELQPREVLLPYALGGILVLLPASFLPRSIVLVSGLLATPAALVFAGGGAWLIPGLFLLGMAAGRYELPELIERRSAWITAAFAMAAGLAIVLNIWQLRTPGPPLPAAAGLATAAAYSTGLLLLLRAPTPLPSGLAPLGRLALTNYLTATPLMLAAVPLVDDSLTRVAAISLAILVIQALWSRRWLRRYHYGPFEWLWRCLTHWHRVPNRIE